MEIDEDRAFPFSSYVKGKPKHSDHFTELLKFNIRFRKQKAERMEVFNFKNEEGLQRLKDILDSENSLTATVEGDGDIEEQVEKWFIELNRIFGRCFRKIRVNGKVKETEASKLLGERGELKQKLKKDEGNQAIINDIEEIEAKVAALVGKENFEKINDNFGKLDQSNGGVCSQGIWDIKKKEFPKANNSAPAAKKDVSGRLVTDPEGLKKVYKDTFINRLRVRPAKESVRETLEIQEKLLEKRLIITSEEETEPWTENDVKAVLKSLKTGKSRDPLGLTNEVFRNGGEDLIKSLTIITNKVRDTCIIPEIFKLMNVSAIYKEVQGVLLRKSDSLADNEAKLVSCEVAWGQVPIIQHKSNLSFLNIDVK